MTSISLDIDYINGYINGESYAKRQYSKEYNQNSDFPSRKYALCFPAFEMHSKTAIHPRNHWMFVLKLTINNISALVQIKACADQATSHCLNQWWLDYWLIYPSLGRNELTSRNTQNDAQLPKNILNTVSGAGTSNESVCGCVYEVVDDTCQIVPLWTQHIEYESELSMF